MSQAQSVKSREFWARVSRLRRQRQVQTATTLSMVFLGPLLVVATFLMLGPLNGGPGAPGLRVVLLLDLVYVLVVATLVLARLARMFADRRSQSAGSRLHLRLSGVFAGVALVPTVLVAIFAVVSVNFGIEGWFSERVRSVVGASLAAAQAYEGEQREDLEEDARALGAYLNRARQQNLLPRDDELRLVLSRGQEAVQRGIKEAYLVDGEGKLRSRGERSYLFGFEPLAIEDLERARRGEIVLIEDWTNNEFRALLHLDAFADRFLYISREVDGRILSLLDDTKATVQLYNQLESERGRLLWNFALIYLGFALILILAAIWLGLWFAERLSRPVGRLVGAAQQVGAGNLDVQVASEPGDDEIAMLGRMFNRMTRQLKGQRLALVENNAQTEARRRLFDSVLSNVTTGVIGLDSGGRIDFVNRAAIRLLDLPEDVQDLPLAERVPEFGGFFDRLQGEGVAQDQEEIRLTRRGKLESLLVRIRERRGEDEGLEGYVVAFDDVTDLVTAQRMAAWGDVARRIAHEIKNPLTPIALSAERLKRKFRKQVAEPDELENLTDVIVRQTNDLRRIVDEFSKFARMPEPDRRETDLVQILRDAVTLQRAGQPEVNLQLRLPALPVMMDLDAAMIGQALTNLIKNAGEATENLCKNGDGYAPEIRVSLETDDSESIIHIADNGIGLPEDRSRLFEPYVTTREKGTGLGLPIVKKIIEEHGGQLSLLDAPVFEGNVHQGALAEIRLPRLAKRRMGRNLAASAQPNHGPSGQGG